MQLIEILQDSYKLKEGIARQYVEQLWKIAPPGLGGLVDPCDHCIKRIQALKEGGEICGITPDQESCVWAIKALIKLRYPYSYHKPFNNLWKDWIKERELQQWIL